MIERALFTQRVGDPVPPIAESIEQIPAADSRAAAPPSGDIVLYTGSDAANRIFTTNVQQLPDQQLTIPASHPDDIVQIRGNVKVSTRNARVTVADDLFIEDVFVEIHFDEFAVVIDWHNLFNVPKRLCIVLFDACGTKLEHCIDFDLGKAKLAIPELDKQTLKLNARLSIQNVRMELTNDRKFYEMIGNVGVPASLFENLPKSLVQGLRKVLDDTIRAILSKHIGGGAIAEAIVDFLLGVWNIVGTIMNLENTVLKITWEELFRRVLNGIEGLIERTVKKTFGDFKFDFKMPVDYPFIPEQSETGTGGITFVHKEVTVHIPQPPKIVLKSGLWLSVEV